MTVVNLIPANRLYTKRMLKRMRAWIVVVAVAMGTALMGHAWISATWHDDSEGLQAAIDAANSSIANLEAQNAASRAAIAEAQATLRARRAVGDQPDWGLLLATLAARLDQQAVLSGCTLEPATEVGAARSGRTEGERRLIRPSKYTLALTGLTRTQDAASSIAIALERTGLFEYVTLLEARRAGFRGEDAVTFRLECALADPAAEVY